MGELSWYTDFSAFNDLEKAPAFVAVVLMGLCATPGESHKEVCPELVDEQLKDCEKHSGVLCKEKVDNGVHLFCSLLKKGKVVDDFCNVTPHNKYTDISPTTITGVAVLFGIGGLIIGLLLATIILCFVMRKQKKKYAGGVGNFPATTTNKTTTGTTTGTTTRK